MNYSVVIDEKALKDFIEWLPELEENETYYVCLFSRKKYSADVNLKADKSQLKRFTSNKKYLLSKISQLECKIGSFTTDGYAIPQESLALYISPNPRSLERAAKESLKKFADLVTKPYTGYNPHSEVLSIIQTSGGTKKYMDFDFDNVKIENVMEQLVGKINFNCITPLITKGGFHLLVEISKVELEFKNKWYQSISNIEGCDVRGSDNLIPVPGCCQGNFSPYFLKAN